MEENQNAPAANPTPSVSSNEQNLTPPGNNSSWQGPTLPKKLIYLFFALLVLLVLTVVATAAVYISKSFKPTPTPTKMLRTSPTPVSNAADVTANWKTYIGKGFVIKYPPNWGPEKCISNNKEDKVFVFICSLESTGNINTEPYYFVYMYNIPNPLNKNFAELLENAPSSIKANFKYTEDEIKGTKIYKSNYSSITSSSVGEIYLKKTDNSYIAIGFAPFSKEDPYNGQEKNFRIFNQILSTFKFTDVNTTSTPTCIPRPACLDATLRCMIAEPANGWCP